MSTFFAIAIGGAIGALSRHWINTVLGDSFGRDFPIGILLVNVLGSLLIGLFFIWFEQRSDSVFLRQMIIVGFLGSLTTFSTFSLDSIQLLQAGETVRAMLNIGSNVVLCIAAALVGILIGRALLT